MARGETHRSKETVRVGGIMVTAAVVAIVVVVVVVVVVVEAVAAAVVVVSPLSILPFFYCFPIILHPVKTTTLNHSTSSSFITF
ncbi:hypothetical protein ElyMa_003936900 [Elysia marginata]|uniref:Transmembrane protein n=1 Tax=Elysia marginata TaxID=1093978 RepID=A0AAV4FRK0_9GAST|nr:hypothetical protein ElyMa_003936900 [Elysia marginata]